MHKSILQIEVFLTTKALEKNLEQKLKKLFWDVVEVGRKSDRDVIWHCRCGRMELWKIWGICGKIDGKGRKNMSDIDYSEKDFEKYIVNLLVAKS